MKAVQIGSPASHLILSIAEVPTPRPGDGQVLVEVQAAGVIPTELSWYPTSHQQGAQPRLKDCPEIIAQTFVCARRKTRLLGSNERIVSERLWGDCSACVLAWMQIFLAHLNVTFACGFLAAFKVERLVARLPCV